MEVPLVTGRLALSFGAQPRNLARELRSAQNISDNSAINAPLKALLENKESSKTDSAEKNSSRPDGRLSYFIKSVRDLAQQITELKTVPEGESAAAAESRNQELANLQNQFTKLTTGDEAKKFVEILSNINSIIQGGGSLDALARGLSPERGTLGSNFLELIKQGATTNIAKVSDFINSLTNSNAFEDLSDFVKKAAEAEGALQISTQSENTIAPLQTQIEKKEVSPLEATTTKYDSGGNLAIAIKGYSGRELIKVAATGAVKDPSLVTLITIEAPDSEEEKRQEKKKAQRAPRGGGQVDVIA